MVRKVDDVEVRGQEDMSRASLAIYKREDRKREKETNPHNNHTANHRSVIPQQKNLPEVQQYLLLLSWSRLLV